MNLLSASNLEIAYGRSQVVFDLSFDVPAGTVVCLMGRNGVGKTTTLNALLGLLPLRAGSIEFDGIEIGTHAPHRRVNAGIGYVPQGHQVFPRLTTLENLQVVLERSKSHKRSELDDALDVFPALKDLLDRPAGLLSGGQAKQLAIARALIGSPRLLVLDEPTEGIQPSIIGEIEDAIANLHREAGLSILLVEQYVDFALRLADSYVLVDGGRVTDAGATADLNPETAGDLLSI